MKMRIVAGVLFLGVLAIVPSQAAAQATQEVLVYDACYPYYWGPDYYDWSMTCDSYVATADPSKGGLLISGVTAPAVSPDAARIAYSSGGIVVLNLSDWSSATVSTFGDAPAWSPDGTRLAFAAGALYVTSADGSGVTQVTNTAGGVDHPAWSPDGSTIAFDCEIDTGNRDICSMNIDGSGFVRLTSDAGWDSGAAYSPDGLTIAFSTSRYGGQRIALMDSAGTNVRQIGSLTPGVHPAWSLDGTRIAYDVTYTPDGVACPADGSICWAALERNYLFIVNADGSGEQMLGEGRNPAWAVAVRPVASLVVTGCDELTCAFDGSRSWGGNGTMPYAWDFGDGTTADGATASHAYSAPGSYTVTLTVQDATGVTATQTREIAVATNVPPTAAFSYTCSARTCTFDGSGSSDPDSEIATYSWSFGGAAVATGPVVTHTYTSLGAFMVTLTVTDNAGEAASQHVVVNIANAAPIAAVSASCIALACTLNGSASFDNDGTIASHVWSFGDNTGGTGSTANHTYAAGGSYTVTLTVTDNDGAQSTRSQVVTVVPAPVHVGDLDGTITTQSNSWTAAITIAVHDGGEAAIPNATVTGRWSDGSSSTCATSASGQCTVSKAGIAKKTRSIGFSITSVSRTPFVYANGANHDSEGDSDGRAITVVRP